MSDAAVFLLQVIGALLGGFLVTAIIVVIGAKHDAELWDDIFDKRGRDE